MLAGTLISLIPSLHHLYTVLFAAREFRQMDSLVSGRAESGTPGQAELLTSTTSFTCMPAQNNNALSLL